VPDPLRFRGVRPHQRGDARKEIHWKASARLRELHTKLYEPATSLDSIFLVNVASYEQYWIQADPEAVELVIRAATELIRHAADAPRRAHHRVLVVCADEIPGEVGAHLLANGVARDSLAPLEQRAAV